jgi:DNA-binding NarL/FixJ family response regulator
MPGTADACTIDLAAAAAVPSAWEEIRGRYPDARLLVLFVHPVAPGSGMIAGACAYLSGSDDRDAVQAAAEAAHARQCATARAAIPLHGLVTLSQREKNVLSLVTEGKTSREIGACLGIASRTVEAHRSSILKKLGVRSFAQLVQIALQAGTAGGMPAAQVAPAGSTQQQ